MGPLGGQTQCQCCCCCVCSVASLLEHLGRKEQELEAGLLVVQTSSGLATAQDTYQRSPGEHELRLNSAKMLRQWGQGLIQMRKHRLCRTNYRSKLETIIGVE